MRSTQPNERNKGVKQTRPALTERSCTDRGYSLQTCSTMPPGPSGASLFQLAFQLRIRITEKIISVCRQSTYSDRKGIWHPHLRRGCRTTPKRARSACAAPSPLANSRTSTTSTSTSALVTASRIARCQGKKGHDTIRRTDIRGRCIPFTLRLQNCSARGVVSLLEQALALEISGTAPQRNNSACTALHADHFYAQVALCANENGKSLFQHFTRVNC